VESAPLAIRELREVDLQAAVGIIARGMRDNPIHIAALGTDSEQRGVRLTRMFAVALPMILSKGLVLGAFDADVLVGIAGMLSPGRCQPSMKDKLALLPRIVPAVGSGAFNRVSRWTATWARHDLAEPHWHLGPVAVDAPLQGRGIGTLLLNEYCSRLDASEGVGYLETDKESNVRFYERFGFVTVGTASILEVPNWFMRRETRRSPSRLVLT